MNYKIVYHKLFNAMTDLSAEMQELLRQMQQAQQECEKLVMDSEESLILLEKSEEKPQNNEGNSR